MDDLELYTSLKRIIETMGINEHNRVEVKGSYILENDEVLTGELKQIDYEIKDIDQLIFEVQLLDFVEVQDLFDEGRKTIIRILRKGKGRCPNIDSIVKLRMRVQIERNLEIIEVINNFKEEPKKY